MEERRLQAARDLEAGMSRADVARKYGVSYVSAWRWAKTLEAEGRDALRRRVAKGAEPKLSDEQKERLVAILVEGPTAHGWATDIWTAPRVREVVRKEFGVTYHVHHVPRLLHGLGFRPRKPRREAAEKDAAKKDEWLRTTWVRIQKK